MNLNTRLQELLGPQAGEGGRGNWQDIKQRHIRDYMRVHAGFCGTCSTIIVHTM